MKKRLLDYIDMLEQLQAASDEERIEKVNQFYGTFLFVPDIDHFDQIDYWQTPNQMLECGAGDCEDFALGKYFTLIKAGVDQTKLRLGYTHAKGFGLQNSAHMVTLYYPTGSTDPLVLDNLVEYIKPLSERKDLVLVYSFNHDGIWTKDQLNKVRDNNLPLWKGLLSRLDS